MNKAPIRLPAIPADVVTVLAATGTVFFLLAFGGKALEAYRLERHNAMLRAEVAALTEQQQALQERREYVETDEYVEKTAREQYKWTKAGEKLVIPIYQRGADASFSTGSSAGEVGPRAGNVKKTQPPFWAEWWRLIAGPFD